RRLMEAAFESEKYEDAELLPKGVSAVHPFSSMLLSYEVLSVIEGEAPKYDPTKPLKSQTKPVQHMFEIIASVDLCDRPNYPMPLIHIWENPQNKRTEIVYYDAKQFKDGDWLFFYDMDRCTEML